jgi:hypothetical protein
MLMNYYVAWHAVTAAAVLLSLLLWSAAYAGLSGLIFPAAHGHHIRE